MTRIQRDMSGHEANIRFQERNEHDRSPLRPYDGAASRVSHTSQSEQSSHDS